MDDERLRQALVEQSRRKIAATAALAARGPRATWASELEEAAGAAR